MKVLAIGAHADDVELGCGGTLLAWAKAGHGIHVWVATESAYRAPDGTLVRSAEVARREAEASARAIGATLEIGSFPSFELAFTEPLNVALVDLIARLAPDVVLTHWVGDTHPDHKALALASLHACRRVPTILAYCSNWYLGTETFDPRVFVDISATLEGKLGLIRLFETENARTRGVWCDWSRAQAAAQGQRADTAFAEAFLPIKLRYMP
jgi:LmbE family N-acetylglucosaminyl deacetylase